MEDFLEKIEQRPTADYLEPEGAAPTSSWKVVYGRLLDPDARKAFFEAYKDIEALWEILSPSAELRDHIKTYKRLRQLYAAVRNAYAARSALSPISPTKRGASSRRAGQEGLGRLTKTVTFDIETLGSLRSEDGPDEGKVYNLVRGLRKEMDDDAAAAVILQRLGAC